VLPRAGSNKPTCGAPPPSVPRVPNTKPPAPGSEPGGREFTRIRWELELAGDVCDHAPRGVLDLGEEGAQESQRAHLDGEAEHGGISAAMPCVPKVRGVEAEEPIELLDVGFSAEATPPPGLHLAEEGDRHFWLPAGRGCSQLKHG
jgi:hypothetical protein